ncbi:uncharacterized protein LOC117179113 isoform X2 [Belonocnema kinseyi]|nr:uncharacterized protein LOC117179113 isoform X2 [Belonocnema kinseyi]
MFHYCSADDVVVDTESRPPQSRPFGMPSQVISRVMEQMQSMNLAEQMPMLTKPFIQAMKNVIVSIEQLQTSMSVLETAPVPNA